MRKLREQGLTLSQARKLFLSAVLKLDDYGELKREYQVISKVLKRELRDINVKLRAIDKQRQLGNLPIVNILQGFSEMDTTDKKHLVNVNLIPPVRVDFQTGDISLDLHVALSKILLTKGHEFYR